MNAFRLRRQDPLEQDIQSAILQWLKYHPRVAWAARFNSGSALLTGKGGHNRPVVFNTLAGCPDILGQLDDGRLLAVEVKRPSWIKPSNERERKQAEFLDLAARHGAVALFARRIEDVAAAIAEAFNG